VETKAPEVPAAKPAKADELDDPTLHKIVSPMVGTFYRAPAPDAEPYVKEGDQVQEDTVVCIVEAMKLMNEIEAEVRGTIVKVLVENGQLVEYGQPLFLVKTS
jgi:acetyl-CoA carboxylase biotin carboxyl carrier protein